MDRLVSVAIIGAGPAGIAAGIYLKRAGMDPLLVEKAVPGGLLRSANLVENYPGFPKGIRGDALVKLFLRQMEELGLKAIHATVESVNLDRSGFGIRTGSGKVSSRVLIVASGTRPADIRLEGSTALMNTKFFTEMTDVPRLMRRDKRAIVIGGGDAAFDYALNLSAGGDAVTVVSRSGPSCLPLLRERAAKSGVDVLIGWVPESVRKTGRDIALTCRARGSKRDLKADLVLTACGRIGNAGFLSSDIRKRIGKKAPPETGVPGLYLAGDVARGDHRQTGIAVGDGIFAAMLAHEFLGRKGGRA